MFPREITSTAVWIRHELPLSAPPPPDGDKKLRQKIQRRLIHATEKEIDEIVRQERARLNLKWCFDEYFGGPISEPNLGQLVTANVIGVVHLAYIVDITSSSVIVLSADTFSISAVVGFDDIYSAEYSPFFDNYLCNQRVYHPQHVLDWWARYIQRHEHIDFSNIDHISLSPTCDDVIFDWPVGKETWFIHDALSQRSQFVHSNKEVIQCIPQVNIVEHSVQSLSSPFDSSSVMANDQPMYNPYCSDSSVMNQIEQPMSSVWIDISSSVVGADQQSSITMLRPHKQLQLDYSPSFTSILPSVKIFLFSILTICLITALYSPVMYHVEASSLLLSSDILRSSLVPTMLFLLVSNNNFSPRLLCKTLLYDVNTWDWFRTLAVP